MSNNPFSYLEKYAKSQGDQPALIYGPMVFSFSQIFARATQVAAAMKKAGLKRGQVALIHGFNPYVSVLLTLAVMHEAAIGAPQVGPKYNPAVAADICFSAEYIDGFPRDKTVIVDPAWLREAEDLAPFTHAEFSDEKPIVRLIQTSGTTGLPKVLEFNFEDLAATYDNWIQGSPEESKVDLDVGTNFILLPFSIFAGAVFWACALRDGKCFYLPTGVKQEDLRMALHYGITSICGSPTMVLDLFELVDDREKLSKVKAIVTGGAAMPVETFRAIRSKTNATIINRFGSTESTGGIAWRVVVEHDDGTLAGDIVSSADVKIVDENFVELPANEIGRVAVRTPLMRKRYRNNDEATEKHFVDGFFYSGDEGYVTEQNQLYLVGRSDERMNFGGRKVDPNQVDGTIRSLPGVIDAAVFGFDQPTGIRGLAVALVAQPNYSDEKLMKAMAEALGSKRPQVIIRVEGIPRNAMGKVQRIDIEKQLSDEALRRSR